jgi:multidrug efflux pump subunit AcrB
MPTVEFPTIRVSASRPGADPAIMASTVAAPLERRLSEIAGVTEITSTSSLGNTNITIVGGLLLSQLLTLYTTPVIYLQMERLKQYFSRPRGFVPPSRPSPDPAE